MTLRAVAMARSTSCTSPSQPQEKAGKNFGGVLAPNTLLIAPTTLAVLNAVWMAVLLWSAMISPQNVRPLPTKPLAEVDHSAISPYVFFKLLHVVSAPKLHQEPRTEFPKNPPWALLEKS